MPQIPIFCDNCNIFYSSGVNMMKPGSIVIGGGAKSICPKCGAPNLFPDGIIGFINGAIEFINSSDMSIERLRIIKQTLTEIKEQKFDSEKTKQEIDNNIPELKSITSLFPKTRMELYTFLGVLLMIIGMCISNFKGKEKQPIEYNKFIINNYYNHKDTVAKNDSIKKTDTINVQSNIQRNNKCPCGSGLKYKFCHERN